MSKNKFYSSFMNWLRLFIMFSGLWTMGCVIDEMPFKQSSRILVASFIFGLALSLAISLPKMYQVYKKKDIK